MQTINDILKAYGGELKVKAKENWFGDEHVAIRLTIYSNHVNHSIIQIIVQTINDFVKTHVGNEVKATS